MIAADLVGVWTLTSFYELDEAGVQLEGPLGQNPSGMLIYTEDGHISVNVMRTSGTAPTPESRDYMGYAGTWRLKGDQTVHTIQVSPTFEWIGSEQIRDAELHSDRLTLRGTSTVQGQPRTGVLNWHRAPSEATG
ncbi:lipocalin-like domain-containing protein [Streptomyces sp. NPDC088116]|uniref:lipocalin-like domain-containing protein n=1 Tax=Streptomyces sp. NPDC088116 TaxID=3365825 RepID=UPI003825B0C6